MMSYDDIKTKKLVEDLDNDYAKPGNDKDKIFLKTLSEAVNTISNIRYYSGNNSQKMHREKREE